MNNVLRECSMNNILRECSMNNVLRECSIWQCHAIQDLFSVLAALMHSNQVKMKPRGTT